MVKNTVGGSKTKGFARKSFNKTASSVVRLPNNVLEKFAIVTKLYGQGRCQVITSEPFPLTLNCIIRNKFKARFKNSNLVSIHSIILVGYRDWETPDFKICDLLEVYSQDDINHIRTIPSIAHTIEHLLSHDSTHSSYHSLPHFEFTNLHELHTTTPILTPILLDTFNQHDYDDIIHDI